MEIPRPVLDFTLVRGALFAALFGGAQGERLRRVDWRALLLPMIAWLPMLVVAALAGEPARSAFLLDVRLHVSLLISLPCLLTAEPYIDARVALALRLFVSSRLVRGEMVAALVRHVEEVTRLRTHPLADLAMVAISLAIAAEGPLQHRPGWLREPGGELSPAGMWWLWVALPLLRFLLLRWLWRATMWTLLLWRIARLPLELIATHPDRAGGLGFLGACQASFAALVFPIACTVATTMYDRSGLLQEDMLRYAEPLLALALVSALLIFAPLTFFSPALLRAKRRGAERFSALAAWHSHEFESRWFGWRALEARRKEGVSMLGCQDASSLADLGSTFDVQRRMSMLPMDRYALLAVIIAALVPMIPLLIAHRRFVSVLKQAAGAFF